MIDSKHLKNNIPSSKLLEVPQEFGWGLSGFRSIPDSGLIDTDVIVNKFKCSDVRISLSTGDTSNIVYVDVHKNDISIFDTQVSIDISGSTSVSATTPFIFSLNANTITFEQYDEVKFYVSGATDCTGLKVKLIGDRIINYDEDTQAFIDVVTTLSEVQKDAINDLVVGLKANNTWDKHIAIYPMIGGTAETHKYNLKDPRDLDAAFRLTFSGTVTHDSLGSQGDGTTGYADTHWSPSGSPVTDNVSMTYYTGTLSTGNRTDMGTSNGGLRLLLEVWWASDKLQFDAYANNASRVTIARGSDTLGYYQGSRENSTLNSVYLNGSLVSSATGENINNPPSNTLYIFAVNTGTPSSYSDRQSRFNTFGLGLTTTEITNDFNVIQTYQTALGREVLDIVRRINMGGVSFLSNDDNIDWQSNSVAGSTSGTDYTINTGNVFNATSITWIRHPSIPTQLTDGDFQTIFDSERWDGSAAPEMLLTMTNFTSGTYSVRLYVGENASPPRPIGFRNYDVIINGVEVATTFDTIEEFGDTRIAGMIQFDNIVVTDTITVEWIHGVENPNVNGIEVIKNW